MQQYRNNPLAPPYMWGGTYCTPAGSQDDYFQYVVRAVVAVNDRLTDQPLLFEGDGCFVYRVGVSLYEGGEAYIQLRDQLGRYTSNQPLRFDGAFSGQSPLAVVEIIPPGAQWTYNIAETAGAGGGFAFFVLIGVKRRKVGA